MDLLPELSASVAVGWQRKVSQETLGGIALVVAYVIPKIICELHNQPARIVPQLTPEIDSWHMG